eukprot:scaffold14938_cov130-Isochrysis_galbana.AAC.12
MNGGADVSRRFSSLGHAAAVALAAAHLVLAAQLHFLEGSEQRGVKGYSRSLTAMRRLGVRRACWPHN